MRPFTRPVRPQDVGDLIDLTVVGDNESQSMADLQLEGVAAIYNILCQHNFAYLADEVGMGKTYQALGLVALLWNEMPDARVLFISPSPEPSGEVARRLRPLLRLQLSPRAGTRGMTGRRRCCSASRFIGRCCSIT